MILPSGTAWAKTVVKKVPNKTLYDIGDSLKLSCQADENANEYKITWYKINSRGKLERQSPDIKIIKRAYVYVLFLEKMKEQKVTYKCEIQRVPVHYRNSKLVTVELKGNLISFMDMIICYIYL